MYWVSTQIMMMMMMMMMMIAAAAAAAFSHKMDYLMNSRPSILYLYL
jgi:hypothetical protein